MRRRAEADRSKNSAARPSNEPTKKKSAAKHQTWQTIISVGESILAAIFSRKLNSAENVRVSRASTVRAASKWSKGSEQVEQAEKRSKPSPPARPTWKPSSSKKPRTCKNRPAP